MLTIQQDILSQVRDWLRPHVRPRRFHLFGIGLPKTGTHSLAAIFGRYRSWHEPLIERFMHIIMQRASGTLSDEAARTLIRRLDRRMWLEVNASYVNYLMLDLLLAEYPNAKFVMTIRDCYSWLDSMFNQLLGRNHSEFATRFHQWLGESFAPGSHQDGDRALAQRGFWPLDLWLKSWSEHVSRVQELVPGNRLLIVRTQDLQRDIPRLAEFVGIAPETLDASRSHDYTAAAKFHVLSEIDPEYLLERVDAICGDAMRTFFPGIHSLADVRGYRPQDAAPLAKAS
jgi:hypothetical protein